MLDIQITNCHIHTFVQDHVPRDYPYKWLRIFKATPALVGLIATFGKWFLKAEVAEKLARLHAFQREAGQKKQELIFDNVCKHYPSNTRFVVLPMIFSHAGYGQPIKTIEQQHDELATLASDIKSSASGYEVIPFATTDPRVGDKGRELWRMIEGHGFAGIKLYPRLGFSPFDPVLMEHVYPKANDMKRHGRVGLPVMSHCSRGGVQGKNMTNYLADEYTDPDGFIPVMAQFPNLRICLAHFGGLNDWTEYANPDKKKVPDYSQNWQVQIRRMIGSGDYPGLWTDISYTMFEFDEFIPFLRLLLMGNQNRHERLRQRILFGSDFYMTRQEGLSEKGVCFRLRNALGEEMFRRMAEENPRVWLGEQDPQAYPSGKPEDIWENASDPVIS
jgi:hypothetical protein